MRYRWSRWLGAWEEQLERIRGLGIPPAWSDVWISRPARLRGDERALLLLLRSDARKNWTFER